ncbi:MAG: glycoside hydrolase family 97 C-terminal domain-containing protein, partial [Bacteroides xylanisolvens]
DEREFEISLDFLSKNRTYDMTWFEDGINAKRQAMDYRKKEAKVSSTYKMKIKIVKNGGWTAVFK